MSDVTVEVDGTTVVVNVVDESPSVTVEASAPAQITVAPVSQPTITVEVVQGGGGGSGNATSLQGYPVSTDAPSPGEVLTWTGAVWEPEPATGGVQSVTSGSSAITIGGTASDPTVSVAQDAAQGTTSTRKLGTGSTDACAGDDSRLSDTRTPTDASVTTAKLDATLAAKIARLTARRLVTTTTSTLAVTDGVLQIDTSTGTHTCTLPGVAAASGMPFTLHKVNLGAQSITLVLAGGDTGAKIYFLGNSPVAGASLLITDSVNTTQPAWLLYSDGTDWWVA